MVELQRLGRYAEIARFVARHAGSDVASAAGFGEELAADETLDGERADAQQFVDDLEELGPTFIKLGQLLATRSDLLPTAHREALEQLEDEVEGVPFDEIREVVEDELGVRLSKVFPVFDEEPLASASLAQVHVAELRDGRRVAVKVQRPGVRRAIREDLEVLAEVASLLDEHTDLGRRYRLAEVVDEFRRSLIRELDFRREATNLETIGDNISAYERLVVPRPVEDLSTARVLTMEYVDGQKVTDAGSLWRLEVDGGDLADELFGAYLKQVLADGMVHADPHPGNVLLTQDGRLALIDLGMVVRLEARTREQLLKLLLAVADGETAQAASTAIALGEPGPDFDELPLRRGVAELVGRFHDLPAGEVQVGRILMDLSQLSGDVGLHPPTELTLLARTLLHLDNVGRTLDPGFDTNDAIRRHASAVMTGAMLEQLSPSSMMRTVLETKELAESMPGRLNAILGSLADGEFQIRVEAIDERRLEHVFQKLANRVAAGLVVAALIVGAAMLTRVETAATIFGYPALAMVFFLVAAVLGIVLVLVAVVGDERPRRRRRR